MSIFRSGKHWETKTWIWESGILLVLRFFNTRTAIAVILAGKK